MDMMEAARQGCVRTLYEPRNYRVGKATYLPRAKTRRETLLDIQPPVEVVQVVRLDRVLNDQVAPHVKTISFFGCHFACYACDRDDRSHKWI